MSESVWAAVRANLCTGGRDLKHCTSIAMTVKHFPDPGKKPSFGELRQGDKKTLSSLKMRESQAGN